MSTNTHIGGVSVVICCYNSAERLTETLRFLSRQQVSQAVYWELVLVDNASTDCTADLAVTLWSSLRPDVPFISVYEGRPGLGHARKAGMGSASCKYILFCDDDNWLCEGYVQGVFDILSDKKDVAACGGKGVPVFEIPPPEWFGEYQEAFAVGSQELNREGGKLLNLYGAGLAINRVMIEELHQTMYKPFMTDRVGKSLSSSGDTELTYSLVLLGYHLYYSEKLEFFHYMPKERLTYSYLKRLFTAFGTDGPVRNLYYAYLTDSRVHQKIRNWGIHFLIALVRLVKYLVAPPKKYGREIYFRWNLAYLKQLFVLIPVYASLRRNIMLISDRQIKVPASRDIYRLSLSSKIYPRRQ